LKLTEIKIPENEGKRKALIEEATQLTKIFSSNLSLEKKALPKKLVFLVKVFAKQKSLFMILNLVLRINPYRVFGVVG
jgi:hypothetical protein